MAAFSRAAFARTRWSARFRRGVAVGGAGLALSCSLAAPTPPTVLPGTQPLERNDDLSVAMVAGIDRFAQRTTAASVTERATRWHRDLSSPEAYAASVAPNRAHLRRIIGAVDPRVPRIELELTATTRTSALLADTPGFTVSSVRWPAFGGVHGEGLLLQPKGPLRARIVALPDADETPEEFAGLDDSGHASPLQRLAANGCQVLVLTLVNRADGWSGNPRLGRLMNQPHREWIYRPAFEMGRHIIGYEVQKVQAAVDWFTGEAAATPLPLAVIGRGEGALLALHAAALDPRIGTTWISGYFEPREQVWAEPIYRNLFGLLREFGDAELASLIVPRGLVIDNLPAREVPGPPAPARGRVPVAAPGRIVSPARAAVEHEFARARSLVGETLAGSLHLADSAEDAFAAFWKKIGIEGPVPGVTPNAAHVAPRPLERDARQQRQVQELAAYTQQLVEHAEDVRQGFFWQRLQAATPLTWPAQTREFKPLLWDDVIGRLPAATEHLQATSRRVAANDSWTAYDVVLPVWPEVFAWGVLLLPTDLKPGERRPVVVCQHGLEGLPEDTFTTDPKARSFAAYKGFAARLAERGFIVFAPHNPYRGRDEFRRLQRKLNPLGASLFSVILAQHDRILDWLSAQPFVDPARIAFYGLSYGGKTAMRVPALLERYALSICSGDFNEWVRKTASSEMRVGYVFTPEYDMYEFNLGHTFNYAEMAALIAPRPFMVERGHQDTVATDEWVAYEYAKVRRLYAHLGISDRTAIEFFDGPHTINGVGTFEFLHRHLNFPPRPTSR